MQAIHRSEPAVRTAPSGPLDAIVIGSGFGGGVAAARLAQAGLTVAVLERGRQWRPGDFPRDTSSIDSGWLWEKSRGLYDVRWLDSMVAIQAAGWGGGSLIYANVFARPPRDAFDHWPASLDRETLGPYFDLAAHMLRVRPVGKDPRTGEVPARTRAIETAVGRMERPAGTVRPLLAVNFADATSTPTPGTCTFVGECMFGCNEGAKNSIDRTYLAVATRHGAVALTGCEVEKISPVGDAYRVDYSDLELGEPASLTAPLVFLAAGAVGTTELLLRNRDVYGTLPRLSPTLGSRFSGNGDHLALVERPRPGVRAHEGPTITTTTVVDCTIGNDKVWFQVQDGAYPRQIDELIRAALPAVTGARRRPPRRRHETLALLMMGRDSGDGRLSLDHRDEARVDWAFGANRALVRAESRAARQMARQLGGRIRQLPGWALRRTGVTVHALGGAPVGEGPETGVIDAWGRVHGYPGMYVVDGAGIPASTGANPSATIAAVAEWRVEAAVRRVTGVNDWVAPERRSAAVAPVPEDAAMRAVERWRSGAGRDYDPAASVVRFEETMVGHVRGAGRTSRLRLDLGVALGARAAATGAGARVARLSGTVLVDDAAVPVWGELELFPAVPHVFMRYRLSSTPDAPQRLSLTGTKVHRGARMPRLADLTTLAVDVEIDAPASGEVAMRVGSVQISPRGVLALLKSVRAEHAGRRESIGVVAGFAWYFAAAALAKASSGASGARVAVPSR